MFTYDEAVSEWEMATLTAAGLRADLNYYEGNPNKKVRVFTKPKVTNRGDGTDVLDLMARVHTIEQNNTRLREKIKVAEAKKAELEAIEKLLEPVSEAAVRADKLTALWSLVSEQSDENLDALIQLLG